MYFNVKSILPGDSLSEVHYKVFVQELRDSIKRVNNCERQIACLFQED